MGEIEPEPKRGFGRWFYVTVVLAVACVLYGASIGPAYAWMYRHGEPLSYPLAVKMCKPVWYLDGNDPRREGPVVKSVMWWVDRYGHRPIRNVPTRPFAGGVESAP